jgi:hypothetical protein
MREQFFLWLSRKEPSGGADLIEQKSRTIQIKYSDIATSSFKKDARCILVTNRDEKASSAQQNKQRKLTDKLHTYKANPKIFFL